MENTIGLMARSLILSLMMGMSCQAFFETVAGRRKMRYGWMERTAPLAFAAGFMVIAVTKIPPYVLQPVRVIVVVVIVAQIYFSAGFLKNLIFSVIFCGVYWLFSVLGYSVVSVTPAVRYIAAADMVEPLLDIGYLGLMSAFRYRYQKRVRGLTNIKWGRFGLFALAGIMVSIAVVMAPQEGSIADYYARMTAVMGFAAVYVLSFYYMVRLLEKESQMQKLRLLQEQTQSRMELYQSMKEDYERQRRYQHDYKNQLGCIQGMIESGQTEEATAYIARLTGSFKQGEMCINTNHGVVNVMLNRKYREACGRGIGMTIVSGDLSGLTVCEEDLVTLLGNLLDNAIEACEKLEQNRMIQFKMVLEEGQLVLSVRNPVREAVRVKDNRIATSKKDKSGHGIGLLNVDAVIAKNKGTSVIRCEDGWFTFSAMIPMTQEPKEHGILFQKRGTCADADRALADLQRERCGYKDERNAQDYDYRGRPDHTDGIEKSAGGERI